MYFDHDNNTAGEFAAKLAMVTTDGIDLTTKQVDAIIEPTSIRMDAPATTAEAARILDLAVQIGRVFSCSDVQSASKELASLLATIETRPHVVTHGDGRPHLHFAVAEAGLPERVASNAVMGVALAFSQGGLEGLARLREGR